MADHDGFLIDLDGVVYVGDTALPGAAATLAAIRARGKRIVFLTNDPRSSRTQYRLKLESMGVEVAEEEILSSGYATAIFLRNERDAEGRRAFVIGSPALRAEMEAVGLTVTGGTPTNVDFVVVGGHELFDYRELRTATQLIRNGAELFATGRDATFPMPDGPWPGTGAIVAAVETAAERTATTIGKPERHMFETARQLIPDCKSLAVIGDRIDSDIEGGNRAGLTTVLIGKPGPAPIANTQIPDLTIPALAALLHP